MFPLRCTTLRQCIRSFLVAVTVGLVTCMPLKAAQPGEKAIGDWKFTSVLDNVEIASIDDEQAKKLLGRVMTIRKDGTRFGDQACGAPSLQVERVEPNIYVRREAQISARRLQLPNPVDVVDIGCTRIFIKQRNKGVIFWDGFFFAVVKIK